MKLFSKEEVNTARQFEFDLAKAVCIFGMVFVHCFDELPLAGETDDASLYYIVTVVLDALFGAGTFMICMGIGLTYTRKNRPADFIKRGLTIFLLGYVLNIFRIVIPACLEFIYEDAAKVLKIMLYDLLYPDIMQFAGLALMLFGALKKIKVPDLGIALLAIAMSVAGTFLRSVNVGSVWTNELLGNFIATAESSDSAWSVYYSPFALFNWFIIVAFGYFYGKVIRRCKNTDKFYAVLTPVSAAVVIIYMIIAIPNGLGMMAGEKYYFQLSAPESLVVMMGAVFAFGAYHYISKLFGEKAKAFITGLAVNINKTYCIHWVIIGFASEIVWILWGDGISTLALILTALAIYVVSSFLAELVRRRSIAGKRK